MTARYDRAPSERFLRHFERGGLLAPLLERYTVAGLPLDVQFRVGDEAHLYCGQTRLLTVAGKVESVTVGAHRTYAKQESAADVMRSWRFDDVGFEGALRSYLAGVRVRERWTAKEGAVQAAWMGVTSPWIPIDREAVLGATRSGNELDQLAIDPDGRLVGWS